MNSPRSERPPPLCGPKPWSAAEVDSWLLGLELFGMDFGTARMRWLLAELGDPQLRFRAIHVVGSNGKSSTARMAEAILRAHGVRSGAYLSPHLRSWSERVRVAGEPLDEAQFAAAAERVAGVARRLVEGPGTGPVTQFEALTAIAFLALAQAGVEAAVVEAGLGGRLDATNVIDAPVAVCTSVGLEHTQWLGETIGEIATEKLAVVAPGSTLVVSSDLAPEAMDAVAAAGRERDARIVVAPGASTLAPPGTPPFLSHNLALALAACHAFLGAIDQGAVSQAIADGAVSVPGRFEIVSEDPVTVFDGAHNPAGMEELVRALGEARRPLVACVAVLDDKDGGAMLAVLAGVADRFVLTGCAHPRSVDPATLAGLAVKAGAGEVETVSGPHAALDRARELAGPEGTVVATGSLYLIADLGRPPGARGGSTL